MISLLGAGFSEERVFDYYTMEEIQVFHEGVIRNDAFKSRQSGSVIRIATNAKNRDWKKFIKSLEDVGRRLDAAMGRSEQIGKMITRFGGRVMQRGDRRGTASSVKG